MQIEFQVTNTNLGYEWNTAGTITVLGDLDQFHMQDWKLFEVLYSTHRGDNLLKRLQYQNPNH